MPELLINGDSKIKTLTWQDVDELHKLLEINFFVFESPDPVEPRGIKDLNMLESAVQRQMTGLGTYTKYNTCYSNAATLIYGIIKNHAFYNGNKRTGLLSLIKHLYLNNFVLSPSLRHDEIYKFVLAIADNKLVEYSNSKIEYKIYARRNKLQKLKKWSTDQEIGFITFWIQQNAINRNKVSRGSIKISELKDILRSKGIYVEQKGTRIIIYRLNVKKVLGIIIENQRLNEREYSLGGSMTEINSQLLAKIRKAYCLTEGDGVDYMMFEDDKSNLDEELRQYKKLIYRLGKT